MKLFAWIAALALTISQVSAEFVLNNAPTVVSQTESSLTIEWEQVEGSMGCYYAYSNESVENGLENSTYDIEGEDLYEWTGATIENLEAGKTYYIAIECMDEEAETTGYSPELVVTLGEDTVVADSNEEVAVASEEVLTDVIEEDKLELLEVSITASNKITLSFNNELDNSEDSDREVSITGDFNILEVSSYNLVNPTTLEVELVQDLSTETEYNVTVISLLDVNWNNIEAWIDWATSIVTPVEFPTEEIIEEVVVEETPVVEEEIIAEVVEEVEAGIELEAASSEAESLPDTGAKEILLVLAALMLGMLVINLNKKES